jgi:hypothetical protein
MTPAAAQLIDILARELVDEFTRGEFCRAEPEGCSARRPLAVRRAGARRDLDEALGDVTTATEGVQRLK